MAYATINDLMPRRLSGQELAELTNDDGSAQVDQTNVNNVLTEASAKVDSYCRERYVVPLQPSEQVKGLTLDIAVYLLFLRRRRIPPEVQQAYDNAVAFLQDVAKSNAGLDQPANALQQASSLASVPTSKPEKFSDSNLAGYIPEDPLT